MALVPNKGEGAIWKNRDYERDGYPTKSENFVLESNAR